MWTKSRERGAARKYLSGNFKAGHVTPNEHYLSRAGLRGRKRYLFLGIFILLYIMTVAHLLVSENHCTLIRVSFSYDVCAISHTNLSAVDINCSNYVTHDKETRRGGGQDKHIRKLDNGRLRIYLS